MGFFRENKGYRNLCESVNSCVQSMGEKEYSFQKKSVEIVIIIMCPDSKGHEPMRSFALGGLKPWGESIGREGSSPSLTAGQSALHSISYHRNLLAKVGVQHSLLPICVGKHTVSQSKWLSLVPAFSRPLCPAVHCE
jgi:hypothetical protein